ncbi:CPBP family glutamic-type intramembrane protease [Polaribacter sp. MSW13]|uniref:CPBP family glutamic-type intramembrane protease n=1 Tax=Polaribacter marinus TaxID=2916838 RepID=A0A9X1VLV3_9FLAO|nr:CPBP family intramembrane glutamic endopeptidase [Polaribacter marinus]MCI2228879.1 CPBP family glutamic-type intramembrane protease [Polaribacter marinus]
MQSIRYKFIELFILFIVIPISFVFNYSPILKLSIGVLSFIYIIYILFKIENITFKINKNLPWKFFWKSTFVKLIIIALVTSAFVWFTDRESLFVVILNKPKLWVLILLFYSLFSVYPQELIYRTFFFKRYKSLIQNETLFILTNALIFSLAHLFFENVLVLLLTFIGGVLFAFTFKNTKSTFLVSIEHAIYGCWLFTVGMGTMLGFPS